MTALIANRDTFFVKSHHYHVNINSRFELTWNLKKKMRIWRHFSEKKRRDLQALAVTRVQLPVDHLITIACGLTHVHISSLNPNSRVDCCSPIFITWCMKTRISYYIKGRAKVEGTSDYPYPSPSDSSDLNTEKNHKKTSFISIHFISVKITFRCTIYYLYSEM